MKEKEEEVEEEVGEAEEVVLKEEEAEEELQTSQCAKKKKKERMKTTLPFPRGRLIKLRTGKALQMTAFLVNIAGLFLPAGREPACC